MEMDLSDTSKAGWRSMTQVRTNAGNLTTADLRSLSLQQLSLDAIGTNMSLGDIIDFGDL